MLKPGVARRFAVALFDLAKEKGMLDQVESDLSLVSRSLQDHPELRRVLEHEDIGMEAKLGMIRQVLGGRVSPLVERFLGVVVSKRREDHLEEMHRQFVELLNAERGVLEGEVRSAVPLTREQLDSLVGRLTERLGKTVKLKARVDPGLIGGLVVRIGDMLIDDSVRTRLRHLQERLARQVFGGEAPLLTLDYLSEVVNGRRTERTEEVYTADYTGPAATERFPMEAEVRSAVALTPDQLNSLAESLSRKFGRPVQLKAKVEPELIGGLVVRAGDFLIDDSVRTRIKRLQERLVRPTT